MRLARRNTVKRLWLAAAIAAGTVMSVIVPLAGANVPGVQITSRPANPTSSTSATFQFVNSLDGGAAFECQLDGGAFSSCAHPLHGDRTHRWAAHVRRAGAGLPSDGDSFTWTVDTTPTSPPTVTLTLPGSVRRATARAGDRTVLLTWAMPETPGIASVLVRRSVVGDPATTIEYRGLRTTLQEQWAAQRRHLPLRPRRLRQSRQLLRARRRDGDSEPLLATPEYGARLAKPPLLRWTPVAAAEYFNVQLYRNGTKILSAWPNVGRLQLASRWQYGKNTYTLEPGVYTWYVWPGLGARADVRYGALLGRSSFVVVARGQG